MALNFEVNRIIERFRDAKNATVTDDPNAISPSLVVNTELVAGADRYSLLCRGLSPPTPCRFSPALSQRPLFASFCLSP
jgi:hypothetical protein